MANFAYFEIPADNVKRAKKFYASLLGWEIKPTAMPASMPASFEYQDIRTGEPAEGTLAMGGMYKREDPQTPLIFYASVNNIDDVIKKVVKLGGRIHRPKMMVEGVGPIAVIEDTEGNAIGIWEPHMG